MKYAGRRFGKVREECENSDRVKTEMWNGSKLHKEMGVNFAIKMKETLAREWNQVLTRKRCQILQGTLKCQSNLLLIQSEEHSRSFRGGCRNHDTVLHGVILLKSLDELGDGGTLLTNGDVDTVQLLALVAGGVVPTLLVENGVEGNSGLTGLTVTNDQLTLTTANGHHGVDTLQTSLDRLVDGTTGKDTRSLELGTALGGSVEGTLAINGVAESIDDAAEKLRTDGDIDLYVL
jgi:hypothetical protein